MDLESGRQQLKNYIKKYQYVLLVILIGVFLMLLPGKENVQQEESCIKQIDQPDVETRLSAILSKIQGVGNVEVLLTEASGSNIIYQMDSGQNQNSLDTVIVTDNKRTEVGLVKQIQPPKYRGAVIVCQGADKAIVRLCVVDAVKSVTGLSSDCITVLKMK